MNKNVNNIRVNPTASGTARRARRALGASLVPPLVLLAVACGADTEAPDARETSIEAALGSDRHLELQASEIADRVTQQRQQAAHGSDRHFGTIGELAAAARQRAVHGSDRHLEMLATAARLRAVHGSDRHLEMLAAEQAARTSEPRDG